MHIKEHKKGKIMNEFDIIVIGGGRASNLAKKAGEMGKKVAIIEKSKFGGNMPKQGLCAFKTSHWLRSCCKSHWGVIKTLH